VNKARTVREHEGHSLSERSAVGRLRSAWVSLCMKFVGKQVHTPESSAQSVNRQRF